MSITMRNQEKDGPLVTLSSFSATHSFDLVPSSDREYARVFQCPDPIATLIKLVLKMTYKKIKDKL